MAGPAGTWTTVTPGARAIDSGWKGHSLRV